MITVTQMRAARALLGLDQRALAELASLSVPTIQRMEASEGFIRGNVDSLMKLVNALDVAGIELRAGRREPDRRSWRAAQSENSQGPIVREQIFQGRRTTVDMKVFARCR